MDFPTISRSPSGPPAMDLEGPRDILVPSEDLTPDSQWDPMPGGPGSLSRMELDESSLQELVQQFEALPGDLVGPSPGGAPCPLHIATGHGLASQEIADAHGLLSAEAGRDDLLGLLHCEECPPSQTGPEEPLEPAPRLLQPPEDPDEDSDSPEWVEGASAEQEGSRSSSSSPEPWLETVPLVTPEEPPAGAQCLVPVTMKTSWTVSYLGPGTWGPPSWCRNGTRPPARAWPRPGRPWTASRPPMGRPSP